MILNKPVESKVSESNLRSKDVVYKHILYLCYYVHTQNVIKITFQLIFYKYNIALNALLYYIIKLKKL